ncbi:MAG: hypothetical protein ACLFVJ_10990 [Persicimonas sp.]
MKCKCCGHRYRLTSGGIGRSDPPGQFFFAGHALLVNAGVLGTTAYLAFGIHTTMGMLLYGFGGVLVAGGVLAFLISATVAMLDQYRYGSWPVCPECNHEQAPRPWSI